MRWLESPPPGEYTYWSSGEDAVEVGGVELDFFETLAATGAAGGVVGMYDGGGVIGLDYLFG